MKVRQLAVVCCLTAMGSVLQGCASDPTRSPEPAPTAALEEQVDIGSLPQTRISSGSAADIKAVAMGAARSKGWLITESKGNHVVFERPIDGEVLANLGAETPGFSRSGGSLKVTTFFLNDGGGITVATKADLVDPKGGERGPTQIDVTSSYRDALEQSLSSLRSDWSSARERLARATPPAEGWKSAWDDAPAAASSDDTPIMLDAEPETAESPQPRSAPNRTPVYVEEGVAPRSAPAAKPQLQALPSATAADARPTPEPRRLGTTQTRPPRPLLRTEPSQRLSTADTASPKAPEKKTRVARAAWSDSAESFARSQGCRVTGKGAELIEARRDGEIHKVSCSGRDSVLVKCQNGTCKGLL